MLQLEGSVEIIIKSTHVSVVSRTKVRSIKKLKRWRSFIKQTKIFVCYEA